MISVGASALLCGGFATPQKSSMGRGLLDCWRFTISPQPTWDPMRYDGPGPENRYGHSMAYDDRNQVVFVFGGVGMAVGKSLNDCWYLNVSSPTTRTWSSCNPTSSLLPHPRHGHASAFHVGLKELFVFDGIVDDGESQTPQSNFWVLKQYTNRSAARWVEIMPISASPSARAYHAMWMAGFQIYVHGGRGPEGVGASSVSLDSRVGGAGGVMVPCTDVHVAGPVGYVDVRHPDSRVESVRFVRRVAARELHIERRDLLDGGDDLRRS